MHQIIYTLNSDEEYLKTRFDSAKRMLKLSLLDFSPDTDVEDALIPTVENFLSQMETRLERVADKLLDTNTSEEDLNDPEHVDFIRKVAIIHITNTCFAVAEGLIAYKKSKGDIPSIEDIRDRLRAIMNPKAQDAFIPGVDIVTTSKFNDIKDIVLRLGIKDEEIVEAIEFSVSFLEDDMLSRKSGSTTVKKVTQVS